MTGENLIKAADEACPYDGVERLVWLAAVRMLIRFGAVLCPKVTSVRFDITSEEAHKIINRAVIRTRMALDAMSPKGEDVSLEEAAREDSLAYAVYSMR